jgi:histone acetyltransferase (RNA polymerase elongator complex component)
MSPGSQDGVARRCFIVPVFLPHAGCPHRCVFCDQQTLAGADHDPASGADWRDTASDFLRFRAARRTAGEIAFYGGTFLGLPEHEMRALLTDATAIVRRERLDGIRFSTRPDSVTDGVLDIIADYPVVTVELGAQSMSDGVLRQSGRGHTAQDTVDAVGRLRARGYRVGLQIMVGLPGEDADEPAETGRRIAALAPDFVRIYPTLVLAGSELELRYREGRYRPLTLGEAVTLTAGLYRFFRERRIPVVRTGVQATRDLAPGAAVISGPFHPAFGELVQSACYRQALAVALRRMPPAGPTLVLRVHPCGVSRLRGHRNETIALLEGEFGWTHVRVEPDARLPEDAVALPDGRLVRIYDAAGTPG